MDVIASVVRGGKIAALARLLKKHFQSTLRLLSSNREKLLQRRKSKGVVNAYLAKKIKPEGDFLIGWGKLKRLLGDNELSIDYK